MTNQRSKTGLRRIAAAALAALTLAPAALAGTCALFHVSEHAAPGQTVLVRGSGFDSTTTFTLTPYSSSGAPGTPFVLSPQTGKLSAFGAILQLPGSSSLSSGVYRIDVSGGSLSSGSLGVAATQSGLVNAPRIQWSDASRAGEPSAGSGNAVRGQTVRLVGRNLSGAGSPTVSLVDTASPYSSIPATVTTVNAYYLKYTVPASATVGHTYSVVLGNGVSGSMGSATAPETLTVAASGSDPYDLGTYWGLDFATIQGNGFDATTDTRFGSANLVVANDGTPQNAHIQSAIDYAYNHGGGQVYLPHGTYNVDDGAHPIVIKPGVVLCGQSDSGTILKVGGASGDGPGYYPIVVQSGGSDSGMALINVQNSGTDNGVMETDGQQDGGGLRRTRRFFLKYCTFDVGAGREIQLDHLDESAILFSRFTSTGTSNPYTSALSCEGLRNSLVVGNTVGYRAGRFRLTFGYRDVVEGNTVDIDYANRPSVAIDTGGLELSYGQQILADGNTLQGTTPSDPALNGEMMLSQSGAHDFADLGLVNLYNNVSITHTSANTWLDTGQWWLVYQYDNLPRSICAFVDGPALGEWRPLASYNSQGVFAATDWDVVPDATSRYAVGSVSNYQQTWVGNTVSGGGVGCMFYDGGIDSAIASNALTDAGGIVVRGASQRLAFQQTGATQAHDPTTSQEVLWDVSVQGNSVTSTTSAKAAVVSILAEQENNSGNPGASLALGVDIRDNSVSGAGYTGDGSIPFSQYDGYELFGYTDGQSTAVPLLNWGTILENNSFSSSSTTPTYPYRQTGISVHGGQPLSP